MILLFNIKIMQKPYNYRIFDIPLIVKFDSKHQTYPIYFFIQTENDFKMFKLNYGVAALEPLYGTKQDKMDIGLKFLNNNQHIITNNLSHHEYI